MITSQFDRPGRESVIVRRAIVRYALTCPQAAAKRFIADLRQRDLQLVADVAESLAAEKAP